MTRRKSNKRQDMEIEWCEHWEAQGECPHGPAMGLLSRAALTGLLS